MKTIRVKNEILAQYQTYGDLIGQSAAQIIEDALVEYLETHVEAHVDGIAERTVSV